MELNLPQQELKIKQEESGATSIYDVLRRKFVALTPEEWVRQNFMGMLINQLQYPQLLMNNEVALVQNGIKRRCDSIVYDNQCQPWMIIEYKAPSVAISQKTFEQIVRYNMVLRAKYLVVSNGINHYICKINYETNSYEFLQSLPKYGE